MKAWCVTDLGSVYCRFPGGALSTGAKQNAYNQSEQRNVTSTATVSDAMLWNGDSPLRLARTFVGVWKSVGNGAMPDSFLCANQRCSSENRMARPGQISPGQEWQNRPGANFHRSLAALCQTHLTVTGLAFTTKTLRTVPID